MRNHKKEKTIEHLMLFERGDGRPEVYDTVGEGHTCMMCDREGHILRRYKGGEIFLVPPNNVANASVGWMICRAHLPDDVVIYDPRTDMCRDKSGENTWRESTSSQGQSSDLTGSSKQ